MTNHRILVLGAAFAVGALVVFGACSSDDSDSTSVTVESTVSDSAGGVISSDAMTSDAMTSEAMGSDAMTTDAMTTDAMSSTAMSSDAVGSTSETAMSAPFGPGCASVPADGAGSFAGMAADPAATAASNNPDLSTLVEAVKAAGLVDTLNGEGPFTILAPTNDAFAKVDPAALSSAMADPKGALSNILTLHVIGGKAMSASDLLASGSATSVQGGAVTFTGSDQDLTVNGNAKVVCGNVKVGNGVVHIIDTVLMPK